MSPRQRRMIWPALILGVGFVWILQGLDLLGGEGGMNGDSNWILWGAITSCVALVLLAIEFRRS